VWFVYVVFFVCVCVTCEHEEWCRCGVFVEFVYGVGLCGFCVVSMWCVCVYLSGVCICVCVVCVVSLFVRVV